jgi:hypothetical protein
MENSEALKMKSLYEASYGLVQNQRALTKSKQSSRIAEINEKYDKSKLDILLTTDDSLGNNSIKSILFELRRWSDSELKRYQSNCSPASEDVWVHNKNHCPSGYKINDVLGASSCLLIPSFSKRQAVYRYSTQTECEINGSKDFKSIGEAVGSYVEKLNNYITSSNNLLENLKLNNNNLNEKFVLVAQKILIVLEKMDGVIEPLVDIFENVVGDSDFYNFVNCCKYF